LKKRTRKLLSSALGRKVFCYFFFKKEGSSLSMAFLDEPTPPPFTPMPTAPGITRIVAPNPGPFTYHGTNSWLIEGADGLTVIDPGPDDAAHIAAIAGQGRVARILLSHTHPDHLAGAPALARATGAPIYGWGQPWAAGFTPDVALADGEAIAGLTVIHTPGHASDHVCFAQAGTGVLFTGDHVMSWSTSIVSPPDGDMADYMAGLRRLLGRADTLYLCGHGPPMPNPLPLVRGMLSHRAAREASIVQALGRGPASVGHLVAAMYAGLDPRMWPAAERSVLAHLLKLRGERRVAEAAEAWHLVLETN
jgi:glyoxylase-like metal-dependent hydrolase (beta-lactamase superfamily II)